MPVTDDIHGIYGNTLVNPCGISVLPDSELKLVMPWIFKFGSTIGPPVKEFVLKKNID